MEGVEPMRKQYASTETFNIPWIPIPLMSTDEHIEWLKEQDISKSWIRLMLDKELDRVVEMRSLKHKETIKKTRHKNPFWIGGKY